MSAGIAPLKTFPGEYWDREEGMSSTPWTWSRARYAHPGVRRSSQRAHASVALRRSRGFSLADRGIDSVL